MNQIKYMIVIVLVFTSKLFSQCENSHLADYNNDNNLDILDMVVLVEQIMNNTQDLQNSDINSDGVVDIIDVVKLVLKILNPFPLPSEITYLSYSNNSIFLNYTKI